MSFSAIGFGNANGLFYESIITNLGIKISQYSLINTVVGLIGGYFSRYYIKLIKYIKINYLILFGALMNIILSFLLITSNNPYFFFIISLIKNFCCYFITSVTVTLIILNWFKFNSGFVTSFVMVFTGIGGGVISPLIEKVMSQYGVVISYMLTPIISTLCLLPMILFVSLDPKDKDLIPYKKENIKLSKEEYEKRSFLKVAYFCFSIVLIANVYTFIPYIFTSKGLSSEFGALGLSMIMYGNVISKIIFGIISDKFGLNNTIILMITLGIFGFCGLILLELNKILIIICSILYGCFHSVSMIGIPLYINKHTTKEEYADKYARIIFYVNLASYLINLLLSISYDCFNTYFPALLFTLICCIIGYIVLLQKGEKNE